MAGNSANTQQQLGGGEEQSDDEVSIKLTKFINCIIKINFKLKEKRSKIRTLRTIKYF